MTLEELIEQMEKLCAPCDDAFITEVGIEIRLESLATILAHLKRAREIEQAADRLCDELDVEMTAVGQLRQALQTPVQESK